MSLKYATEGRPPAEALSQQVADWMNEANHLRLQATREDASAQDDPQLLHEDLVRVRNLQDRLEELVSLAVLANYKASEVATTARRELEEAWDRQATSGTVKGGWNDAAPRERYASYRLACLNQERDAVNTEQTAKMIGAALEVLKLRLRGMDGTRQDLNARIRLFSLTTSLER